MTESTNQTTTLNEQLTGEDLEKQRAQTLEAYESLTEREKQTQASFWAQNFLIAELAAANRLLRDLLLEKGVLSPEEDTKLAEAIVNQENLRQVYENTEKAFFSKYQRVRFAMENPEEVEKQVQEMNRDKEEVKGDDADAQQ